jgi:hypothetical protein
VAPFALAEVVDASERGWGCLFTSPCNNGTAPNNSYYAGTQVSGSSYRNWLEFDIPTLTGPLLSAALNVDEPTPLGQLGAAGGRRCDNE